MGHRSKAVAVAGAMTLGTLGSTVLAAAPAGAATAQSGVSQAGNSALATCAPGSCKLTKGKYLGKQCRTGGNPVASVHINGPESGTRLFSKSLGVKTDLSMPVTPEKALSKAVGFDVARSYLIAKKTSYKVGKGKQGHISAYPCFAVYRVDMYSAGKGARRIGNGLIYKPVAITFKKWTTQAPKKGS